MVQGRDTEGQERFDFYCPTFFPLFPPECCLSAWYKFLSLPNIFTGSYNFHQENTEHLPGLQANDMYIAAQSKISSSGVAQCSKPLNKITIPSFYLTMLCLLNSQKLVACILGNIKSARWPIAMSTFLVVPLRRSANKSSTSSGTVNSPLPIFSNNL